MTLFRTLAIVLAYSSTLWAADPVLVSEFFKTSQSGQKELGTLKLSPAAMEKLQDFKGRTVIVTPMGKVTKLTFPAQGATGKEVTVVWSATAQSAEAERAILKAFEKDGKDEAPVGRPAKLDLGEKVLGRFSQRDQGRLGTCHAFSNIPLIEALENRYNGKKGLPFRASENWMVFASTLDRLCGVTGDVRVSEGWYPDDDLKRLLALGYCEESMYMKYDSKDGMKGIPATSTTEASSGDALIAEATRLSGNAKFMKGEITNPEFADKFKKSFGIDWKLAKDKLCDPSKDNVDAVLKSDAVSREFKLCLKLSREKAAWLREADCKVNNKNFRKEKNLPEDERKERIDRAKDALARDMPVFVSIRDYLPDLDPEKKHTFHAVAMTGWDDDKKEFKVLNSWGPGKNASIPYARMGDVYQIGYLACTALNVKPGAKGAGPASHGTTDPSK